MIRACGYDLQGYQSLTVGLDDLVKQLATLMERNFS